MVPVRRFVTGHDGEGKSVFLSQGEPPQHYDRLGRKVEFFEVWSTAETPALLHPDVEREPNERLPLRIPPDPGGTIIRILDIHPGHLEQIAPRSDGKRLGMHRTETIDYGIMIEGELTMYLDDTQVELRPGDVVVQRGTDHAWENKSKDVTARIAFVLIDAQFAGPLAGRFGSADLMATTIPQKPA